MKKAMKYRITDRRGRCWAFAEKKDQKKKIKELQGKYGFQEEVQKILRRLCQS